MEFDKLTNKNSNDTQRSVAIKKIMDKYGLSFQEANKILIHLEQKETEKNISKGSLKKQVNNSNVQVSKPVSNLKNDANDKIGLERENVNLSEEQKDSNNQADVIHKNNNVNEKKVDDLLEDIIPDYNKQVSIIVDHADLTFEVQTEKIDTLKETFVRTLKRDKSKKIKIHAINDVSFKIYKGEKVGIIGYNGAGKSTLLNLITGIYHPDKGSVTTYGNISPLLSLGAGFDQNFSGRKNIILNGAVLGYDKEYLESKVDEIIEFSELGEYIDIPIKNYSSGMLAKLGFSIATAVNPDILIIDEILGVGDVNFQKKSADKMKSLMDGGTTVLLVSHSIPQIRELCDKAIWIDNGKLREIGEVNKVCDHYLKDSEKANNEQLANIQFR
ncbi:ABC transporter ATP-binding protein [Methanobrevibacter sp.]|uniref:ABC transporter ATP-binding protein n=1 Tax=Methanobrevibacter sp. TaxID=66852 RepID=UPI002E79365C|nr:ABC transporter ATP-binding protein [Methanobrevibacter sp.]MEE0939933.1 ABC transporter ATP-binding protein [Methanobrevibacter sp.]